MYRQFLTLITRELSFIRSDNSLVIILLLAPLFYSFFYASIYTNKIETDVPITVIDADNTLLSREFIRKFDSSPSLKVETITGSLEEAKDQILTSRTQAGILIPKDFETDRKKGIQTTIKIYLNTTRFLVYNDIKKGVNEIVFDYANTTKEKVFRAKGYSVQQAEGITEPIALDVRNLFNPSSAYGNFLLPAIMILIIQQTLLIGIGESIAKERELTNGEDLFNAAHRSVPLAIYSKSFIYIIVFTIFSFFFFTVNFKVFNIEIIFNALNGSSIVPLMFVTILFIIATALMGLFFGSFFSKKITVLQVVAFGSYPLFFITGYSYPLNNMPKIFEYLSKLIPATAYTESFTKIGLMGSSLQNAIPQIINLMFLIGLFYLLTFWRMKKIMPYVK